MARSILILGGGVFGFTAALELRRRGWEVTLLERGGTPHPDAASTDLSKVVRIDYGADAIYTEMAERSLEGWRRWNAEGARPLYHEDGFLVMTRDEEMRPGGFEFESHRFLTARGHALRRIRRPELARLYPAWNASRYGDGYLNPAGGWVESGAVVAWLASLAREAGVAVVEQAGRAEIAGPGSVAAAGSSWRADRILVAAGGWTPFVLPELATALRTTAQPVIRLRPADTERFRPPHFPVWGADIGRTGWYGFPATDGGIVKVANHGPGRPVTDPAQPRGVTDEEVARFRLFLAETFPPLADALLAGTRECWYCDSFDGHFWIAAHPGRPGTVVAAGDSGHAFKFAPVLGGLIADVVEDRPHPWAGRFGWRERREPDGDGARARE